MSYHFNIAKINDIDEEEPLSENDFENEEIDIDELGERDYRNALRSNCCFCNGDDNDCLCCGFGNFKTRKNDQ